VPARNEGAGLRAVLRSLAGQTTPPDWIVVVVNNSADDTADVAAGFAAEPGVPRTDVLEVRGRNFHRKAGALNRGITWLAGVAGNAELPRPSGTW